MLLYRREKERRENIHRERVRRGCHCHSSSHLVCGRGHFLRDSLRTHINLLPMHINLPVHINLPTHINLPVHINLPIHINLPVHINLPMCPPQNRDAHRAAVEHSSADVCGSTGRVLESDYNYVLSGAV